MVVYIFTVHMCHVFFIQVPKHFAKINFENNNQNCANSLVRSPH